MCQAYVHFMAAYSHCSVCANTHNKEGKREVVEQCNYVEGNDIMLHTSGQDEALFR